MTTLRLVTTFLISGFLILSSALAADNPGNGHQSKVLKPYYSTSSSRISNAKTISALNDLKSKYNCQADITWNIHSGTPHRVLTSGIALSQTLTQSNIESVSRSFIDNNSAIFGLTSNDLKIQTAGKHGRMWYVIYDRYFQGLKVYNARADLTFNASGKLVSFGADTFPRIDVNTTPSISQFQAESIVKQNIPLSTDNDKVETAELLVLPLTNESEYSLHLAWKIIYRVPDEPALWYMFVDAHTGEVLLYWDAIAYEFSGTVTGDVQPFGPFDEAVSKPLKDMFIETDGYGQDMTDESGEYSIDASGNTYITAQFASPYVNVIRYDGGNAYFYEPTDGVLDIDFTGISQVQERDAYYHTTAVHDYIKTLDPDFNGVDYQMRCNINVDTGTCNAFWDGYSINFYADGNGCYNSGKMSTIIYHEYGHGITQYLYAPIDLPYRDETGGLNEGWSDFIANCITDQPVIGHGWRGEYTNLRITDNDSQYPGENCMGEPHCMGYIMAGALWHMRENLIADNGVGIKTYVDSLWHFSRYAKPMSYHEYLTEILLYDDDDGNIYNGTPHYSSICAGFGQHNIACPELSLFTFSFPGGLPDIIFPEGGDSLIVEIEEIFAPPAANSGVLHYNIGGGWQSVPMNDIGGGRYKAIFPALDCGKEIKYYFSAETESNIEVTDPRSAPGEFYSARSAYAIYTIFADNFETDQGWTIVNSSNLTGGAWERGIPAGYGDRGDPANDYDGSGQCYLTENVDGDSDVDGESTALISPLFDLSNTYAVISFAVWYTNDFSSNPNNDIFRVWLTKDDGATWRSVKVIGPISYYYWQKFSIVVNDIFEPTDRMRLKFEASDLYFASNVEAAVDDIRIVNLDCVGPTYQYLPGDVNMHSANWPPVVQLSDITYLVNYFRMIDTATPCYLDGYWGSADANGDCRVIGSDVTFLVSYFRGLIDMRHCSDYPPSWHTSDDLPSIAPEGWPNCND